ncbi:MAG TPA: LPS-assembly protein LptD [Bacteroidetes bacterium]|nr:LPS-assembly protein LptD [Bacteroidota bacterium]
MSPPSDGRVRLLVVFFLFLVSAAPKTSTAQDAGITEPVEFVAGDSLIFRLGSGDRKGTLHGAASVKYDTSFLSAHEIDILLAEEKLHARGLQSDSGWVGQPTIVQGDETFLASELSFSLQTQRGRFVSAQTQYEEGFIRADVVKSVEDSTLFIRNGLYTTCACIEDPSYSLRSDKMKMVGKKWIYTGPIQLFLFDIPTPLWLPFGFLPAQDSRRSGPLPPTYGEDEFGFYLRDWGWYFALNDFMDLQLQGGFWTKGSWESRTLYRYRKMYSFDGQLRVDYARFRNGEPGDPNYSIRQTGSFRWTHNQTIGQNTSFNANVNMSSSSYLQAVSQNYDDRVRQDLQSSIKYSTRWSGRSLSIQANQRQVLSNGNVTMTLPSLSFSQRSFKPLARESLAPGQKEGIRERLTVSYNMTVNNRFSYSPLDEAELLARGDTLAAELTWLDALTSSEDYERATGSSRQFDFRATHRIPISAPFSIRKLPALGNVNLNFNPSISYPEDWYLDTEVKELDEETAAVGVTHDPGFFALRQFSTSLSMSTTFYGMFPIGGFGYKNIRHTIRPNIGFSYRPDFYADRWGNTKSYVNSQGEEVIYPVVSGVGRGRQQALTFSMNNTFETKPVESDSTDTNSRSRPSTLKLFDFNLSSSYNFAADSLKMGAISLSGRTRILGKVDVDIRRSYSPYQVSEIGRTISKSAFSPTSPLGRLTSTNLTIRTSLRSKRGAGDRPLTTPRAGMVGSQPGFGSGASASMLQNTFRSPSTDFSIPWSLILDFTMGSTHTGASSIKRAILNATIDFSLTPNWKVASRTGYDLESKRMATTNIALARDFDCWQMAFNWIPFGSYQSWGFDLHVKSGHLRDLLRIRQPKSDVRDRFGSFL